MINRKDLAMRVPLENPGPDIEGFRQVILRQKTPERPPFVELHIDKEVVKAISEKLLNMKWVEPSADHKESQEASIRNYIECHYRMGYDFIRLTGQFRFSAGLHFPSKIREGQDTAFLSRGQRAWVEEGAGVIGSWEDFEKYPWPSLDKVDLWALEFAAGSLPENMGIMACPSAGVFEIGINNLFGYENLSYLLYDNPELVKAVFDKIGKLIYGYYQSVIGLDKLAGFFQGEDMGFKTGTLIAPKFLREYILPWHKKFAQLAHEHDLIYILHSCGNLESIMEDLIEDVNIDAKHSFEDSIMPVTQFKKKYGDRIAVLGGVDVDKMCRLDEPELRDYVRNIVGECIPGGGYALGSGNSITNYIPLRNYLVMLDEGLQ
jgi:uroporphyrinogen decarboxylase